LSDSYQPRIIIYYAGVSVTFLVQ